MPKTHPNMLQVNDTIIVVIDVQEALLRNLYVAERMHYNICTLLKGAAVLRIPILGTTQNSAKLGDMLPDVRALLPALMPPFDKLSFSCLASAGFAAELQRAGRKQVVLVGAETHICVSQTAHDLLAAGYQAHVVSDAVSSRTEFSWRLGLDKMRQAGILLSSVETALFELLREAGTPEFREILKLVK